MADGVSVLVFDMSRTGEPDVLGLGVEATEAAPHYEA